MSTEEILSDREIIDHFNAINANFGPIDPVQVIQHGLLKAACGWHNGFTCDSMLQHHGLITRRHNEGAKLTTKGKRYLWEAYYKRLPATADDGQSRE